MRSQYGSLRPQFTNSDWGISTASGGSLTSTESVEFFIQGQNRVGLNLLSPGKVVSYTPGQKIIITINSSARNTGEDIHKYIISMRRGTATPIQIAEIEAREANHVTYKTYPLTLELTHDQHLSTVISQYFTTGSARIHGQIRSANNLTYRYDETATRGYEEGLPGYWVEDSRGGFVNITSTKNQWGCDQSTGTADMLIPIRLSSEAILSTEPVMFWWANNLESNTGMISSANTVLTFQISINGAIADTNGNPYAQLFDNQLLVTFNGYVDVATGELDTDYPNTNSSISWTYRGASLTLPAELSNGYAASYSVNFNFDSEDLLNILRQGATIGMNIIKRPAGGVYSPTGQITGDAALSGLYILPNNKVTRGSGVIGSYQFEYFSDYLITGIAADTANQKVVISPHSRGTVTVKNTLSDSERVRAIISTEPGVQTISNWSDEVSILSGGALELTITYPVNANTELATIRANYSDNAILGLSTANFNVPKLYVYVLNTSSDVVYRLPEYQVLTGTEQTITITSFDNAEELTLQDLPESDLDFGLFNYGSITGNPLSNAGNFIGGTYQVAIAYYYPENNFAITKISHDPALGCLPDVRNNLVDILNSVGYWLPPVVDIDALRVIEDNLTHGAVLFVIDTQQFFWYNAYSLTIDDGLNYIQPESVTGPGRWLAISSGSTNLDDLDWENKGDLIVWSGTQTSILRATSDSNSKFLKRDSNSSTGWTFSDLSEINLGGDSPYVSQPENIKIDILKNLWTPTAENQANGACLALTQRLQDVNSHYLNIVIPPTGTALHGLVYDPVTIQYQWRVFSLAGLTDTYSPGTQIPHNSQLIYDAGDATWKPGTARVIASMTTLEDTFISSPTDGEAVIWDSFISKFSTGLPDLSSIDGIQWDTVNVVIPGDTFWNNVRALVSGRNPGTDLSIFNQSIAVVNATTTNQSPYASGTFSYSFNSVSRQSVQIPTNSNTIIGANPFCVDFWVRPTELLSGKVYFVVARSNDVEFDFALNIVETSPGVFNPRFFGYNQSGQTVINMAGTLNPGMIVNTWYHIAVTRNGNDWRLFVNGVQLRILTANQTLRNVFASPNNIFITLGRLNNNANNDAYQFIGQIEDFRLTIGTARYISAFTPPTTPAPNSLGGTKPTKEYYLSFSGLIDVDETVTPLQDYVPAWDTIKEKYVPKPIGAGGEVVSLSINQITGLDVTTSQTDYIIAKDSDGVWRGRQIGSGVTAVNGLSGNVTLTSDDILQGEENLFLNPGAIATELAQTPLETLSDIAPDIPNQRYLYKNNGVWSGVTVTFPVTGVNNKTGAVTLTTSDIEEGTNEYYTNAKVDTRAQTWGLAALPGVFANTGTQGQIASIDANGKITFIAPFTNAVSSVNSQTGAVVLTTTNINEGTRLYYTDARVDTRAQTWGIAALPGVFANTGTQGQTVVLDANGKLTFTNPSGGNVSSVNSQTGAVVLTTSNINEGTRLYYTDARVDTRAQSWDIGDLPGVFANTGTQGQMAVLDANGKLTFTNPIGGEGGAVASVNGLTGIVVLTTSNVAEGTNEYYTNAKVDTRAQSWDIADLPGVFANTGTQGQTVVLDANGKLTFTNPATGNVSSVNSQTGAVVLTTSNISEGTNEYYTNAKVDTRAQSWGLAALPGVFANTGTQGQIASIDANGKITFIAPFTNAVSSVNSQTGAVVLTTTNINEGTRLYYTDARVDTRAQSWGLAALPGVFANTGTQGQIPSVDSNGKLALGNPVPYQQFRDVTGNHTLEASDHGKIIRISSTATVTLPSGLPNGFQVTLLNMTSTVLTLASSGTIQAKALTCSTQYAAIYATHVASNTWIAVGDLT